ncbi:predicted protein [Naegleria gruberi]|uniref:Predicted protein n=1 Tax=Naegleria gruberi TaxID=5762 RepID=D2V4J1_NAEGR|nr:uncharacterized protein NAEGRDRAFT_63748 [Naegleria gruberi]EFC48523.1 predicted protein [Naegleria gruberi]|eukprot:XP_002681267.1 predicted protein [Naegleria gruberi strain NEG-M]
MIPKQSREMEEDLKTEQKEDDIILIKPKTTSSNPLVFSELQQKLEQEHNLFQVSPTTNNNGTISSPRIAYLKIEENSVTIHSENIILKTHAADLCYCVHDRLQSPTIHIVAANRSNPHIEYVQYNYKTQTSKYQIIDLPKEQRIIGLDIGHGNPSVDSILMLRVLSGEKEIPNGFFFSALQANQHYKNMVFSKFLRELEMPPEDPNLQTPITPNIGHSPSDLFPTSNMQQQIVLNTILRELKEMKSSIDFKLDKITHELSGLDKRVHNIENILSHSNVKH